MSKILFEQGETNEVSPLFSAPATITGYNLLPDEYVQNEHGLTTEVRCGDHVTFERVLTEDDYEVVCSKINSGGIRASTPLLDECGAPVKLTACRNIIEISGKGNYRAVYSGQGRYNAIVSKD